MHFTLTLLAAVSLPAAPPNLDLAAGKLTHWEGHGATVAAVGATPAVTTAGGGAAGTALLHRTLVVPPDAFAIEFAAAAYRPEGLAAGEALDVILEAARRRGVPREVRRGDAWEPAPALLGPDGRRLREYRWRVDGHAGRAVRIAVIDADDRPGCHVVSTGFRLVSRDEHNARRFTLDMRRLREKHRLRPPLRLDSKHFMALTTADEGYAEYRLHNCETIHALFFEHFRKRGFAVRAPAEKLMVALFDTQEGFEAYVGRGMPATVTGLYHPSSNRLVVYDFGTNRAFASSVARAESEAPRTPSDLDRLRWRAAFGRAVRDRRDDVNISTVMHEVAHQLSFNGGMLNRHGDVPVWLAEGLAVYCESTARGGWQGIGEPNPSRAAALRAAAGSGGRFLPLLDLIRDDAWIRKARRSDRVLLGYSQSWALFRLLIEERPQQLRAYMQSIHDRRTPDHRLTDFAAAFGNPAKLEKRYRAFVSDLIRREAR